MTMIIIIQTVSSTPTHRQIEDLVVGGVTTHWRSIGIQLLKNEDVNKLNTIASDFPGNHTRCCNEMFRLWFQSDKQATWKKLLDALEAVGLIALADDIKKSMYIILYVYRMSC